MVSSLLFWGFPSKFMNEDFVSITPKLSVVSYWLIFFYVVIWLSVVSKFQESILISWVNTCFWYDWWSKYTLTFLTTQAMRYEGMLMSICTYKFWCVTTIALSFFLKKMNHISYVQCTGCREHLLGDSSLKFYGISSLFNPQLSTINDEAMLISIGSS